MKTILTLAALGLATSLAFSATPAMACGGCDTAPESIDWSDYIDPRDSHYFEVHASSGETMYVDFYGYHDWADVDVLVTDERGRPVASGTDSYADEVFSFVARREGTYYIEVVNLSSECVDYDLSVE
jgi:hypothetical protein